MLTGRSNLSCQARVKLLGVCWSNALLYSLDSVGITLSGLQKVRVLVQQQLRAISRMPAHLTKVTNQELLSKLGVTEPGAHILSGVQRLLQGWRTNQSSPDCIPVKASQSIFQWRQQLVNGLSSVLQSETQGGRTFLTCVHCGLECANKSTLGWRIAKVHAAASKPMFNRLKHSMEGMPRCSGCTQLLSSSSRLQKHIEKGACPRPIEAQLEAPEQPKSKSPTQQTTTAEQGADQQQKDGPLLRDKQVRQIVQQQGWRALVEDITFRPKLAQWCCLCGTLCVSNRAVKMHLARTSSVSTAPKAHVSTCPVLFQSILLELLINGGLGQASGAGPTPVASGDETDKPGHGCLNRQQPGKAQQKAEAVDDSGQARTEGVSSPARRESAGSRQTTGVGRDAAAPGGHRKAFFKDSRGTAADPSGLWVYMVCGHGAGKHSPCDVQHKQGMAQDTEHDPRTGQQTSVHHDDGVHPDRAQGQDFENNPGSISEGGGGVSRSVHGKRPMGVQMMEPGPTLVLMDAQPLPTQTIANMLDAMLQDIQEPGALRKFHASRQLQEDMTGHKAEVCFTIQVALRGQAAERLPAWCRCVIAWPSGYPRAGCDRKGAKLQGWQKWWRIFYADSH